MNISMVDLRKQYLNIQTEIDRAVLECIRSTIYINGPKVKTFQTNLEQYLGVKHVIPCGNGTDALQIALMSLGLDRAAEVIVPAFTYVSTAEVIGLLGLTPVMIDVDEHTFHATAELIEQAITAKTKAIIPVHLFGQSVDMEPIMKLATKHHLHVVEDNAQGIGADYTSSDSRVQKVGTLGHMGCTSFYPSKNLGAYGDGGAMFTNDDDLAAKLRKIANHGQSKPYYHDYIGVNSRLDAVQATILDIKLKYLDAYAKARQTVAAYYDHAFREIDALKVPVRQANSTHVFHQYTLQVLNGKRDELKLYLQERGVPSMVYYPVPLHEQVAFKKLITQANLSLPVTQRLCKAVISLPIHTEMEEEQLNYITDTVIRFFS